MAAMSEVSRHRGRVASPALSARHAEGLRTRLLAGMGEQTTQFAQHAASLEALTGSSCNGMADRDRAMAALSMYVAYEAMEAIEDALARIEYGNYGLCQTCGRPLPPERIETNPAARVCADCQAPRRGLPARATPAEEHRQFDATSQGPRCDPSSTGEPDATRARRVCRDMPPGRKVNRDAAS